MKSDGWKWSDDTAADYFKWANNEPNGLEDEECVEMYPWDGTWNDVDCNENRGFVCKKHIGELVTVIHHWAQPQNNSNHIFFSFVLITVSLAFSSAVGQS